MNNILKQKKLLFLIIITLVLILFFLMIQAITPYQKGEEKIVIIEKGLGSDEIGQILKEEKIIKSKWFFVFYTWLRNYNEKLQAGEYLLKPTMSVQEISKMIASGQVRPNWKKTTILEGWTNEQIENKLRKEGIIQENIPLELQGFLFPDTYYFYKNSTIDQTITKMTDNFDTKITKDLIREIEEQNKTLYDILIMASIIEKEVRTFEDMQIVSGIFWKRINNNYPLQSCATIAYILKEDKPRYSYEETRIESPYNTYTNAGLPPTPINNPGILAIKAAIYPEETEYNFFLTNPKNGETIFSKTAEEHNQNKQKYLK
ncbi:MAG: endolytic transglycosylase MltG [Candidatus Portnoybacteria bacterium]|nr:endolytic transglycosylase MltG [Candidatus Portnoybacteria bacterium]